MDLQRFLKAVQVLTGCSVVVLAIYNFITVPLTDFQTVVLNAYLVFFGLILALSGALGASATPILKYFAFLQNWFGIGAYQLWLGLLCFNPSDFHRLTTWVGLVSIVCGIIGMIVHCTTSGNDRARQPLLG
jgi:hypothetical protein